MTQSKTKKRRATKGVIKALALAGAITTTVAAPNSTILIDTFMKNLDKKEAKESLASLKYRRLIEVKSKDGDLFYKLTNKGVKKYKRIIIDELEISTPKKWDKKWRMVLFDIPVTHRKSRQHFLHKLRAMDFYLLQHSAWIHPFDCKEQVGVLLKYLDLEQHVSFLVVEQGNFNKHAIEHFKKTGLLM